MNPRQELDQLVRDAKKPGAYQAKSAYAKFLLRGKPTEEEKELAKSYLDEVIANKDAEQYKNLAELSLAKENKDIVKRDAINNMTDAHDKDVYFFRKMSDSPEFQYKVICEEERQVGSNSYENLNNTISKLKELLNHGEMTDTLLAKIYFRLIHLHIMCAHIKGNRHDLEEAKRYCLLFNTPALYDMKKAINARRIYIEIENGQVFSSGFGEHVVKTFRIGQEISRLFFKYIGLGVGSVLDLCTLFVPKIIDDYIFGKKERDLTSRFKGSGFGGAFKDLGKGFGKYIIGNVITGPLVALFGAITYPFVSLYSNYKKVDDNVTAVANNLFILNEGEGVAEEEKNILQSTGASLKKIFDRPNAHKPIIASDRELKIDREYRVEKEILTLHPNNERYAYGVVFANAKKIRKANAKCKKELETANTCGQIKTADKKISSL